MYATAVRQSSRDRIRGGRCESKEGVIIKKYPANVEAVALAIERTSNDGTNARVVCNIDGTPAPRALTSPCGHAKEIGFYFEADHEFCVVELQHGLVTIAEVVLRLEGGEYHLVTTIKAKGIAIDKLEGFDHLRDAIASAKARLSCPDTHRAHYFASQAEHDRVSPIIVQAIGASGSSPERLIPLEHLRTIKDGDGFTTRFKGGTKTITLLVNDHGSAQESNAQVVCRVGGGTIPEKKRTTFGDEPIKPFAFEINEPFVAIRVSKTHYSIWRVMLTTGHVVQITPIISEETLHWLTDRSDKEQVSQYFTAINRGLKMVGLSPASSTPKT